MLSKIENAIVDGISRAEIMGLLLDLQPEGRERPRPPAREQDTVPEGSELVPIASEGVPGKDLLPVRVAGTRIGQAFQTGRAVIEGELDPSHGSIDSPPAVLPLTIEDRGVGVIAIFSTLTQKTRFDAVDFELFKLLGQHAAAALVSASLFAQAERKLPGLEAFLDLSV